MKHQAIAQTAVCGEVTLELQRTPKRKARTATLTVRFSTLARLGGFLGRRQDGEPGVKTLWLGLQRLHDMASIWQLMVANAS